jgi:hypothetical protein
MAEASGQLIDSGSRVVGSNKMCCLDWVVWQGGLDLRWGNASALGNIFRVAARAPAATARFCGLSLAFGSWNIEDVELAAGSWLHNVLVGGVMGNVVPIHDVVVPVSLPLLHGATLEAEGAGP